MTVHHRNADKWKSSEEKISSQLTLKVLAVEFTSSGFLTFQAAGIKLSCTVIDITFDDVYHLSFSLDPFYL